MGQRKILLTRSPLGPASPLNPGIPGSPYGETALMSIIISMTSSTYCILTN